VRYERLCTDASALLGKVLLICLSYAFALKEHRRNALADAEIFFSCRKGRVI